MKIFRNKFYLLTRTPGISGFQQWDKLELRIATGCKAALDRLSVVAEFYPEKINEPLSRFNGIQFRFEDEHVPELQKRINGNEIEKTLREFPHNTIFVTTIKTDELMNFYGDPALKFF